MAIHWKKQEFGLVARIPPVTAAIYRSSRTRACTRRFDWAVFSQGKRLAASMPMRWSTRRAAINDCLRYLETYHPAALEEALHE